MKEYILLLLFTCLLACSKKDTTPDIPRDIPDWLQAKIATIEKEQHGELYVVSEYRIDGITFYNINRPVMSCLICELYNVKGDPVQFEFKAETDIKQVRILWPKTP